MKSTHVNVIFLDPKLNYVTRVNEDQTDEQIKSYFVGTTFAGLGTCINVEITRTDSDPIQTGMEAQTIALYNDLLATQPHRDVFSRRQADHLIAKGWRKPL